MKITAAVTAAKIANVLRLKGIAAGKSIEPDDVEDGEIEITETIHVQVGQGYAGVVVEEPDDKFRFLPTRHDTDKIITDLQKVMAK